MPIIKTHTDIVTQINVFTVPENGQRALIDLLAEAATSCRQIPGWISASLHRSLDGNKVVNYAQAQDQAAMRRVLQHLSEAGFMARNAELGTASPGLYQVAEIIEKS